MDIKTICHLIDERKEELFKLLSDLIKINSESFGTCGNEKDCAEYIHNLCSEMGLDSDIFSPMEIENFSSHPDYLDGRNLENRYNVVARLKGEQNVDELMLMGHTDTVRFGDLSNWEKAPLSGEISDGKIFGRGACDDNYALATALFIMKLLKENGVTLKKNLLFAAYSDEEYGGCHGSMSAVIKYPCNRIVNMDCKEGQIWHCASGGGEVKYLFHTKESVDSAKLTSKAIPIIIDILDSFAENRKNELEANPFYKGTIIPETSLRYMGIKAGDNGSDLGQGEVFFVYYTDREKAEIEKEFEQLNKVIKAKLEPLGIIGDGFVPNTRFFHYVYTMPDSEDIKLMVESAKEAVGDDILVCGSCLSDLSVISKYGSNKAFAFGIGRDFFKKGGAHQPNEYVECEKLVDFAKTIATYVLKVLA